MSSYQENWLSDNNNRGAAQIPNYSSTAVHAINLKYADGTVTVSMDGKRIYSGTRTVNPGYIWFASKAGTTVIYEPTVTELKSISDYENIYDAYYSSNMQNVDPVPESMTNHWGLSSDTTRLSRKTNDSYWQRFGPNMAILYLKKTYYNFDLTTTFSIPGNSDYDVYFGVGAQKGKAWQNDGNASAFTFHRSGGLMNGKAENWITGGGQTPSDKITGYNITGVHTLRLRVVDKVYTAWVDDIQVGTGTLANYTEGYVWFGADDMTATWGIPDVTELKSISDYENVYDAYYSKDLKTTNPTPITLSSQWTLSSDTSMLYKNDKTESHWDSDTTTDVSLLYFGEKEYYNFEIETTVSHATNGDNLVAFFGFGAKKGVSWENNAGDTALSINPQFGAIINAKRPTAEDSWVSKTTEMLKAQDENYDMSAVHTLKIRMEDRNYTVWLDGYKVASGRNAAYTGGYIYFGANALATKFGIPTVTELPNTELLKYDVNGDNRLDCGDVVFLRKVLLDVADANAKCDINGDNKLDIRDLIAIKKLLA